MPAPAEHSENPAYSLPKHKIQTTLHTDNETKLGKKNFNRTEYKIQQISKSVITWYFKMSMLK